MINIPYQIAVDENNLEVDHIKTDITLKDLEVIKTPILKDSEEKKINFREFI